MLSKLLIYILNRTAMLNVLVICLLLSYVHADCDTDTGPAGGIECVLLEPYYSEYQWAFCLTDEFIKKLTKGNYQCKDQTNVYCYYQCMTEIHDDKGSGPVLDDCACGKGDVQSDTTTLRVQQLSLQDWCFSPPGDDCNWYRECLEKRFPCQPQGNSYALDFAEEICMLYDDNYSSFDSVGHLWINAVRKCLQVQLVPILRPFVHKTCDEIKQMAFDSHPDCYINPDNNAPSICQIGLVNTLKVFWTVKSSLVEEPVDTLQQMLCVFVGCNYITPSTLSGLVSKPLMTLVKIGIKMSLHRLIYDMSDRIAFLMNWPERGIMHYVYTGLCSHSNRSKRSVDVGSTEVLHILLASRSEFDLNSKNAPIANVTEAAMELADKIENGDIDLGNGTEVAELNICLNFICTEKALSVTPPVATNVVFTETQMKVDPTEITNVKSKEYTSMNFTIVKVNYHPTTIKEARADVSVTTEYFPTSNDTSTAMIGNITERSLDATSSNDTKTNQAIATTSKGNLNTGSIVGIVFGCILFIVFLVALVTCLGKKRCSGSVVRVLELKIFKGYDNI